MQTAILRREEPSDRELGISALGREDWEDAEAEFEDARETATHPDYGPGDEDDRGEVDQDSNDASD